MAGQISLVIMLKNNEHLFRLVRFLRYPGVPIIFI